MLLAPDCFAEAFRELCLLLLDCRPLWSESAFVNDSLSWAGDYPELHGALLGLSDSELVSLQDEPALPAFVGNYIPRLVTVANWSVDCTPRKIRLTPEPALFGFPQRKRLQTEGFVDAVLGLPILNEPGKVWVDWCSGRGLLARQLYHVTDCPIHCLEIDPALCRSGAEAHSKMDPDLARSVIFHQQDVLQPLPSELVGNSTLHTALHACGDLHLAMLRHCVETGVPCLACSPCCYHSIKHEVYQPLSRVGKESGLALSKSALRLAAAELCTANALERELRDRELLWRTAFDLGLREHNGLESYTPTPSVRKSLLKTTFGKFAEACWESLRRQGSCLKLFPLCQSKQDELISRAKVKLARVQRLEKAQLCFRKPLEYWLLLDRALYLKEHGYVVRLAEFCSKAESGRNVVILASRITRPAAAR